MFSVVYDWQRIKLGVCLSSKVFVSLLESSAHASILVPLLLPCIPLHLVIRFLNTQFHIISIVIIASCVCLGIKQLNCNTKWFTIMSGLCPVLHVHEKTETGSIQDKPYREGMTEKQLSLMFPIELFGVETNLTQSVKI